VKIGIFDSGLGGLAITQAIIQKLPQYDYLYLGDTKRVPYGGRSQETIHEFTSQALSYLFEHDCQLVILACNTASAEALRKSQQEYLPKNYPDRRVLGMIIPTAQAVFEGEHPRKVGVIATSSTVESKAYLREVHRIDPSAEVRQIAAPLLVPLIENQGTRYIGTVVDDYLQPLLDWGMESLVLGCTHYCVVKRLIRQRVLCPVVSQDEVIPEKLEDYLRRHPEIEQKLDQNGERWYHVTDITVGCVQLAEELAGQPVDMKRVELK